MPFSWHFEIRTLQTLNLLLLPSQHKCLIFTCSPTWYINSTLFSLGCAQILNINSIQKISKFNLLLAHLITKCFWVSILTVSQFWPRVKNKCNWQFCCIDPNMSYILSHFQGQSLNNFITMAASSSNKPGMVQIFLKYKWDVGYLLPENTSVISIIVFKELITNSAFLLSSRVGASSSL